MADLRDDELLTTGAAGKLVGLATNYMRLLAVRGKLPATQVSSGYWLFKKSDLKKFADKRQVSPENPHARGRPLKRLRVADDLK